MNNTGANDDLEHFAVQRKEFSVLPPPKSSIPFNRQGQPIPDPLQVHTHQAEVRQETTPLTTNPLPYHRFHGPFPRQINQPQFLAVNDQFYHA